MNKAVVFLCCALVAIAGSAWAQKPWALSREYIQSLLELDEETVLTKYLDQISQRAFKDLYPENADQISFQKTINRFAKEIQKIPSFKKSIAQEQVINQFLFERQKFSSQGASLDESSLETVLLPKVLEAKQGNCLSLSLIFLCLSEKLNIESTGVVLPAHFYVRVQTDEGEKNLEMTEGGAEQSYAFYKNFHLKNLYPDSTIQVLNNKQVLFVYISNLANHYKLQGYYDKAIELFQAALHVLPDNASIHTNLGNAYERKKDIMRAGVQYQKALAFNPYLCETHYNLGLLHFLYTGFKEQAYRHGQVVRALGCPMHPDFQKFLQEYQ